MRRLAKVARIAAKVVLVTLAALVLLVGVTWTFLQTRQGGELVRRLALPRVNAALAGRLTLGQLAFGGDRLTLENVALYDPESRLVAHVARIDVGFSPLALLRRHVDVRRLEDSFAAVDFFEARHLPFLIAINEFDGAPRHPAHAVRKALALRDNIPVITVDARDRHSAKAALIAITEYALNSLTPVRG